MTKSERVPLFTVSNHCVKEACQPPVLNGDDPNTYHSYFENAYGEQSIFVYKRNTGEGVIWCGDADWKPYPVVNGQVEGLILSTEEQIWLQACWQAVRGKSLG